MPSHARCCSPALPLHRHRAPNNAVACPLPPLPPFPLLMPRQRLSMGVAMPPPRQPRGRSPSPSPPPSTAAHCPPMPPQQRHPDNATFPPCHRMDATAGTQKTLPSSKNASFVPSLWQCHGTPATPATAATAHHRRPANATSTTPLQQCHATMAHPLLRS